MNLVRLPSDRRAPCVRPAAVVILAALVAACGGGGESSPATAPCVVSAVTVTPPTLTLVAGTTGPLTAAITQSNCNALVTNWTTSNSGVATVSSTGVVTGVAAGGPVTVTASVNGTTGSAQVTVTPAVAPVASISLSQTTGSLAVGSTLQLTATPRDAGGNALTGRTITWTSNNTSVATVAATGLITGVAGGQAMITASAEGRSASATITVTSQPVASVTLTPNGMVLQPGGTMQLAALTRDVNGSVLTGRTVTWTTSDALVATVNGSGLVTAVNPGAVLITATSEGVSGTATIVTAGVSSNRFGFALANQPSTASYTPPLADQFASGGSPITITRQSDGVYDVLFPNMAKGAWQREAVLVSPGSGSNVSCQVANWNNAGAGLVARVLCFSSTGIPVDGQFSVMLVESGTLSGRLGFTWADQPTAQSYNPNPLWSDNSSGGAVTITRSTAGTYAVRWTGLARTAGQLPETVILTPYGTLPRRCSVTSWDPLSSADFVLNVLCTDVNGSPTDTRFVAMMADRGRSGRRYGLAWADQPSAPIYAITNNGYSRTSTAGAISVSRTAAGSYQVRLGGQARTGATGETVHVTAYGSTAMCKPSTWAANGADMLVTVLCFDTAGNLVDSRFDVLLIE